MQQQIANDQPKKLRCFTHAHFDDLSTLFTGNNNLLDDLVNTIEEDFWLELAQIQAESIGWIPLDEGAYLHLGSDAPVIQVVGIAKEEMSGSNVLWLTQKPYPYVWQSN